MSTRSRVAPWRRGALCITLLAAACGGGSGASAGGTASPSPASPSPTPTPTPTATAAPATVPSAGLLKVAYIGGSITEGAFASSVDKRYASLVTTWLRTRYRQVEERNLGVGGTTSEFAAYRLEHDLAGFVPDLAFVEFTSNDRDNPRALVFADIDAIVFKLRRINPRVRIVYISVTNFLDEPYRREGKRAPFVENSAAAATLQPIEFIDLGAGLWEKVLAGAPLSTYLGDGIHPTDLGYQLYADQIARALDASIPLTAQPGASGSKLITQSGLDTARMVPAGSSATGCRTGSIARLPYMEAALQCDRGDTFTYAFNGTTVGLVRAMVRDGGRLECSVDGGKSARVDFFDGRVPSYERSAPVIAFRNLTAGAHTLSCSVTDDIVSVPEGTSTGRKTTIGYFLVSDERPVALP